MNNPPTIEWTAQEMKKVPGIKILEVRSFYHGESIWYDTEFDNTIYPQNGFSFFFEFLTAAHQYQFYRRYEAIKKKYSIEKPSCFQLSLKHIEKDIWLLQLKYRCLKNRNDELFAYWKDLIVELSQKPSLS